MSADAQPATVWLDELARIAPRSIHPSGSVGVPLIQNRGQVDQVVNGRPQVRRSLLQLLAFTPDSIELLTLGAESLRRVLGEEPAGGERREGSEYEKGDD